MTVPDPVRPVRVGHADGVPRSYPAAVVHAGVVYPCGQVPVDVDGATPQAMTEQVRVVLDNLDRTLRGAGSDLSLLLQLTVHLLHVAEFEEYDAAYRQFFGDRPLPPRTTVFVPAFRGAKRIEMTAIAAVGGPSSSH